MDREIILRCNKKAKLITLLYIFIVLLFRFSLLSIKERFWFYEHCEETYTSHIRRKRHSNLYQERPHNFIKDLRLFRIKPKLCLLLFICLTRIDILQILPTQLNLITFEKLMDFSAWPKSTIGSIRSFHGDLGGWPFAIM